MSRSNLTEAVSAVDRCSDDELRQLQALIAARIGYGKVTAISGRQPRKKVDVGRGKTSRDSKPGPKKPGNPQKKSQYATHPVYKAYRDAKRVVEQKAKEDKVSFKDVTGETREIYMEALSNWMQTKSGFRGKTKIAKPPAETAEPERGENGVPQPMDEDSNQAKTGASEEKVRKKRRISSDSTSAKSSKYSAPPPGWEPASSEKDWSSLNRSGRKEAWRQHDADQESDHSGDRP